MIMAAAIGSALLGMRPVAELRYADFALCAADEIINQAAKARYMLGGQVRVPVVIRQPIGMRWGMAAQHSQSNENLWVGTPGLVVVASATPADNHGLLKAAIRADDPVVFMEHKELWLDHRRGRRDRGPVEPSARRRCAAPARRHAGQLVQHRQRLHRGGGLLQAQASMPR
jgi:pyruvate/2-oxoglutarate/acetoin dehydrogenase E1 component